MAELPTNTLEQVRVAMTPEHQRSIETVQMDLEMAVATLSEPHVTLFSRVPEARDCLLNAQKILVEILRLERKAR